MGLELVNEDVAVEHTLKIDLRCCLCYRADMKRNDGSYRPHKRLSVKGVKPGAGAKFIPCFGYERANATRKGMSVA